MIGLNQGNDKIIDTSFDILALEALFLIPRICSPLLSLNPYFGTLLPCLTAMTKVSYDVLYAPVVANGPTGFPQISLTSGNSVLRVLVNFLSPRPRPIHLTADGADSNQSLLW